LWPCNVHVVHLKSLQCFADVLIHAWRGPNRKCPAEGLDLSVLTTFEIPGVRTFGRSEVRDGAHAGKRYETRYGIAK
jgi:hypothetical protein